MITDFHPVLLDAIETMEYCVRNANDGCDYQGAWEELKRELEFLRGDLKEHEKAICVLPLGLQPVREISREEAEAMYPVAKRQG